jgi:type IV pilus assembly protein PilA
MNKSKGFTIIELIVVIAIIAILAAIVIINVAGYINKSKDGAMREEMHAMQVDAIASANGGQTAYVQATVCASDKAWAAIGVGTAPYASQSACKVNTDSPAGTAWCACVKELGPSTATYYCADSTGKISEQTATDCTDSTHCGSVTASQLVCP